MLVKLGVTIVVISLCYSRVFCVKHLCLVGAGLMNYVNLWQGVSIVLCIRVGASIEQRIGLNSLLIKVVRLVDKSL